MKNKTIVLASGSERRIKLLKSLGIKFKKVESHFNETAVIKNYRQKDFKKLAKVLSLLKVLTVIKKLKGNEIVLGFDTIVVCKNKIIDKPKNKKDALKKLLFLSNKSHKVYTGICLMDLKKRKTILDFDVTTVYMKKITKAEAISYIKTREPFGKAGAYAIQGKGKKFIKKIKGDYYNVVGLPVRKLKLGLSLFRGKSQGKPNNNGNINNVKYSS